MTNDDQAPGSKVNSPKTPPLSNSAETGGSKIPLPAGSPLTGRAFLLGGAQPTNRACADPVASPLPGALRGRLPFLRWFRLAPMPS